MTPSKTTQLATTDRSKCLMSQRMQKPRQSQGPLRGSSNSITSPLSPCQQKGAGWAAASAGASSSPQPRKWRTLPAGPCSPPAHGRRAARGHAASGPPSWPPARMREPCTERHGRTRHHGSLRREEAGSKDTRQSSHQTL